jgi:hypothetical protein
MLFSLHATTSYSQFPRSHLEEITTCVNRLQRVRVPFHILFQEIVGLACVLAKHLDQRRHVKVKLPGSGQVEVVVQHHFAHNILGKRAREHRPDLGKELMAEASVKRQPL